MKLRIFGLIMVLSSVFVYAKDPIKHPFYNWINQQDGPKPEYVWQDVEDIIYHNTGIYNLNWQTAPEFCAFFAQNWVFNRAMKWERTPKGNIFCYSEGDKLRLTGEKQVSKWFSDPVNTISQKGELTLFEKKSRIRVRDAAVLPALQFHLGQHPVLEVNVTDADCDWQFCIGIKGRAGTPFLSSGWQKGMKTLKFNIAEELAKKGYALNYAELNFVMGVFTTDTLQTAKVAFAAEMKTQPAIITSLPVIKTVNTASKGLPIEILLTDANGAIVKNNAQQMVYSCNGKTANMTFGGVTYQSTLSCNQKGNQEISFASVGNIKLKQNQLIRIADNEYFKYDNSIGAIKRADTIVSPMTGSYQGTFYYTSAGKLTERMVQGQKDWNEQNPDELRLHWWESLTAKELELRFAYLQKNGWTILHTIQQWSCWERLDAGGNIAPHGIEQLALYLRLADKYGLCDIHDISHYPYYENNVWQQYKDAGFKWTDWFIPSIQPFASMYNRYVRDLATILKEETAIIAIGASGEGDKYNQLSRSIDMMKTYQEIDNKHLFVAEPIHIYNQLPSKDITGWPQVLLGSRTYLLGMINDPELDMGTYFKLNRMSPNVSMFEGSFPAPPGYSKFYFDPKEEKYTSWVGTEIYRSNLRTSLYMGLAVRQPILMTWDEQFTEDERIVLNQIRKQIRWEKKLAKPQVAILISDSLFREKYSKIAAQYEKYFTTSFPIDYKYVSDTVGVSEPVIDLMNGFSIPKLPNSVQSNFTIAPGYAVTYTITEDGSQILAYFYNISNHIKREVEYANIHRQPNTVDFSLSTLALKGKYSYQLYDLDDKKMIRQNSANDNFNIDVKGTKHDYFLLINR